LQPRLHRRAQTPRHSLDAELEERATRLEGVEVVDQAWFSELVAPASSDAKPCASSDSPLASKTPKATRFEKRTEQEKLSSPRIEGLTPGLRIGLTPGPTPRVTPSLRGEEVSTRTSRHARNVRRRPRQDLNETDENIPGLFATVGSPPSLLRARAEWSQLPPAALLLVAKYCLTAPTRCHKAL